QKDHEAPWSALLAELDGRVQATILEAELQDMRLWGLVDFRASKSGFVGTYAAAALALPSGTVRLTDRLPGLTTESLRQICTQLGFKNPPTRKDERLATIV